MRRRSRKCFVKAPGSTGEQQGILRDLRKVEAVGTLGGAVECVEIERNAKSEDRRLGLS